MAARSGIGKEASVRKGRIVRPEFIAHGRENKARYYM